MHILCIARYIHMYLNFKKKEVFYRNSKARHDGSKENEEQKKKSTKEGRVSIKYVAIQLKVKWIRC